MIDFIAYAHIRALAKSSDPDDVKDAIVDYFMYDKHFTDEELETAYAEFTAFAYEA